MEQLIGASDLVVLPLETMHDKLDIPITLLEAMAAGKPAIVSDLAPMNELVVGGGDGPVRGGDVGFAVPPGDAAALAEAMVALLVDGGLRHDMARRGQTLVRDRFDIRQMARRYEELYQEMA
jgi:glycosyltransferase involved in cell wall biosynthesis